MQQGPNGFCSMVFCFEVRNDLQNASHLSFVLIASINASLGVFIVVS